MILEVTIDVLKKVNLVDVTVMLNMEEIQVGQQLKESLDTLIVEIDSLGTHLMVNPKHACVRIRMVMVMIKNNLIGVQENKKPAAVKELLNMVITVKMEVLSILINQGASNVIMDI